LNGTAAVRAPFLRRRRDERMSQTVWIRSDTRLLKTRRRWQLSLKTLFSLTVIALTTGMGVLFLILFSGTQSSIMQSASTLREQAGREIAARVEAHLAKADDVLRDYQNLR
jgi:hypothetical protein